MKAITFFNIKHVVITTTITCVLLMGTVMPTQKVEAQSIEDLQAIIVELLAQVAALQAGMELGGTESFSPTSSDRCLHLTKSLYVGANDASTGGEVSELQQFLVDSGHYTYGKVTGYYGPVTQAAVQRWQAANDVVSAGTPATTGYGLVGSKTRAAIADKCFSEESAIVPIDFFPVDPYVIPNGTSTAIRVLSPNGGESYPIGHTETITWTPYGYDPDINASQDVTAYLEYESRGRFITVGKIMEGGKASIHTEWEVGEYGNFPEPGDYYVRVVNNKTGATDRSDKPFTLHPRPTVDLKINGVDDSLVLEPGFAKFTWDTTGDIDYCFGTESKLSGESYRITSWRGDKEPSGSMSIDIGYGDVGSVKYGLNCVDENGGRGWDTVHVVFNDEPAFVQVISPNGGETLNPYDAFEIEWDYENINSMSIALYEDDKWFAWIKKDMTGDDITDGKLSWRPHSSLGLQIEGEDNFKIYITARKADGTGYVDDKSDGSFSFEIHESSEIEVDYIVPSSGDFEIGDEIEVSWELDDVPSNGNYNTCLTIQSRDDYSYIFNPTSGDATCWRAEDRYFDYNWQSGYKAGLEGYGPGEYRVRIMILNTDTDDYQYHYGDWFEMTEYDYPDDYFGIDVEYVDSDIVTVVGEDGNDQGQFTIEFDVTAIESDVFIEDSIERNSQTGGVNYSIVEGISSVVGSGSFESEMRSTAEEENEYYVISEGETETFTVVTIFDPADSGSYKMDIVDINYSEYAYGPTETKVLDSSDLSTGYLILQSAGTDGAVGTTVDWRSIDTYYLPTGTVYGAQTSRYIERLKELVSGLQQLASVLQSSQLFR